MKATIFILSIFILSTFNVCSQTEMDLFFTSSFEPAQPDDTTYHISLKSSGRKKIKIRTYEKKQFKWNAIDEEEVERINDSTICVIKNQRSIKIKYTRVLTPSDDSCFYYKQYCENGKLFSEGKTRYKLVLFHEGERKEYYENGQIRSFETYNHNELVSNTAYNEDGTLYAHDAFIKVDKPAQYPGGESAMIKYFLMNMEYPEDAKAKGISGKIFVEFIVNEEGRVEGVRLVKGGYPSLNAEALRVIRSMTEKWTPAERNGKVVKQRFQVPLNFTLY